MSGGGSSKGSRGVQAIVTRGLEECQRLLGSGHAGNLTPLQTDLRCSIGGVGLNRSGRSYLTRLQPGIDVPWSPFADEDRILESFRVSAPDRVAELASLLERTAGEVSPMPGAAGFWVRSRVYQLRDGNPEYGLSLRGDPMGILDPGFRPIVHGTVAGVRCVSLSCLLREVHGFDVLLDRVLDCDLAERHVREFAVSVDGLSRQEASSLGERRMTFVSVAHVLEVAHRYRAKAAGVVKALHAVFRDFGEALPYTHPDVFAFALRDPQRVLSGRHEPWRRAAAIAPYWRAGHHGCEPGFPFHIPAEDGAALRACLVGRMRRDGHVLASEAA